MEASAECTHLDQITDVTPQSRGCEECLATGGWWLHLRLCLTCGYVGCCNDSSGKHATAHAASSGHPIAQSLAPGEDWRWCFVDEVYV